ncbi:MAG: AAA family ATPase [Patescibacteria group bacterium]|jgi:dephospho-CoA kinase
MVKEKIIIGFIGKIAAGKGTVGQYLKEKQNASIHRFSTMLRDIADRLYIEQSRENLQKISGALRQNFGDDVLAKVMAQDVKRDDAKVIVIDGVRRKPDIKYLREIPGFHLVYIYTKQELRYERLVKRGENVDDTKKTLEQFKQDELQEAEQQIDEVIKLTRYTIDNNGDLTHLYHQIDDILEKIDKV